MSNPYDKPTSTTSSVLGPTLKFKGELTANEDLLIQGQIEGTINHSSSLTVGQDGQLKANVKAEYISVEGKVDGDLSGMDYLLFDVTTVGHQLRPPRTVCVIGAGGGRDILSALKAGATDVDAVESWLADDDMRRELGLGSDTDVPRWLAGVAADGDRTPRERWVLWAPGGLGVGIAVYFGLDSEPPLWVGAAAVATALGGIALVRSSQAMTLLAERRSTGKVVLTTGAG